MKILVFGNSLVKKDSMPLRLIPHLVKKFNSIEFTEADGIENIEKHGNQLFILDTVEGIKEPCIIRLKDIQKHKVISIHDCDLGFNLLLLKKLKKIEDAVIIGVPMNMTKREAMKKVTPLVSSLSYSKLLEKV